MRIGLAVSVVVTVAALASPARALAQAADAGGTIAIDDIVNRMNESEKAVAVRMRMYRPLVEVYIQHVVHDEQLGWTPVADDYFLGQFDLAETPRFRPISQAAKTPAGSRATSAIQFLPDGFAASAAPDWRLLTRDRYEFTFVRREFLGEARCFVFDVKPIKNGKDGFTGRIWVEDRGYNMVRFNGINRDIDQTLSRFFRRRLSFHMDGWRVNTMPGVWLPAYVYCEETDLNDLKQPARQARFKGQVRIWGYEAQSAASAQPMTTIRIDDPAVVDGADRPRQLSPVLSQRQWEQEAEDNIIERLEKIGLLAPAGEVDKVLETVLNNLVVTNKLALERPLKCRVLLTAPLETFTVGRTLVVSRGLIDVLPDEASLAAMLAHELAHVALGHPLIDTKFAFADRLMVVDSELLQTLQFQHTAREEAAADDKEVELLQASPYKDRLEGAGLFLRMLGERAQALRSLIQPHIGNRISRGDHIQRLSELVAQAPQLQPQSLDQIPALPMGARTVLNPWSGRLVLDRSPAVPLASVREKVPLSVTPLMPFLSYVDALTATQH
ncbi:MAG: M48 family metalloprotease [Vicinamibacterales bacterium]